MGGPSPSAVEQVEFCFPKQTFCLVAHYTAPLHMTLRILRVDTFRIARMSVSRDYCSFETTAWTNLDGVLCTSSTSKVGAKPRKLDWDPLEGGRLHVVYDSASHLRAKEQWRERERGPCRLGVPVTCPCTGQLRYRGIDCVLASTSLFQQHCLATAESLRPSG